MRKLFPPFNEKYTRTTTEHPKPSFLHIYGAGIVYPDVRYEFTKERDSYLFEYIVSGKGYLECEGERAELSAGDCIVIPTGGLTHYGTDKKSPYVKLWFSARGYYPESLFASFLKKGERYLVRRVNMYSVFERVLANLESEEPDDTGLMCHAMLEIMLGVTGKVEPSGGEVATRASQIKQYIDSFIREDINVKRIAEHLGISERSAVKAFRGEYGISPGKYIRKARISEACRLLETSDKTVSDIAHILRFCDQSYFSTVFKEEMGVYPTEYRLGFMEISGQ